MNEKQQLIKEIEEASDGLIKEVLDFVLSAKNTITSNSDSSKESDKKNYPTSTTNSQNSLKKLLLEIPEVGEETDFERKYDMGRDINL